MTATTITKEQLDELEREILVYLRVVDDYRAEGLAPHYLNEDLECALLCAAGA